MVINPLILMKNPEAITSYAIERQACFHRGLSFVNEMAELQGIQNKYHAIGFTFRQNDIALANLALKACKGEPVEPKDLELLGEDSNILSHFYNCKSSIRDWISSIMPNVSIRSKISEIESYKENLRLVSGLAQGLLNQTNPVFRVNFSWSCPKDAPVRSWEEFSHADSPIHTANGLRNLLKIVVEDSGGNVESLKEFEDFRMGDLVLKGDITFSN